MQLAIQSNFLTSNQKHSQALDAPAKNQSVERQKHQVMEDYLSLSVGDRVLDLASKANQINNHCTDRADLSSALNTTESNDQGNQRQSSPQSLRTPFASGTFSAVVCFRLSEHLTADDLEDMLWEASRICVPGARLVIGLPSVKRHRSFLRREVNGNCCNILTSADLENCRGTRWREVAVVGVDLLAIDRMPNWLRGIASRVNDRLCRTPLRKYARSRAYVLELR